MADDDELRGVLAADEGGEADAELFNLTSTHATNDAAENAAGRARTGARSSATSAGALAHGDDDGAYGAGAHLGGGSPGGKHGGATPGAQATGPARARVSKGLTATRFETVVNETASRARAAVDEGTEEHWNHVMKKLAPQGYQRTPVWQKRILERVLKRMTTRGPEHQPKPLTEKHAMTAEDLALSALSPDAAWPLRSGSATLPGRRTSADQQPKAATAAHAALRKRLLGRMNKVHFYTRAIQMEQLLGQDLDQDVRHRQAEVGLNLRESRGGELRAADVLARIARKERAVANRLQVVVEKANQLEADNAALIGAINDLRAERALVLAQVRRMGEKDAKMDEDMIFLSQAAHAALDQREKVKAKLVQTQRDSALEKAHKLAQLAELASKCEQLEHEFAAKQASIDEHEQSRRRVDYAAGKQRRLAQHQAETKTGFLQSQVDGWNSEFQRLQVFTGMDKVFAPGDDQTIDEITTRYLSKDQQNTSLLRYLHAQQVEVRSLEAEMKATHAASRALEKQLQHAIESDSAPVMDFDGLAQKEAEAAYRIEAQLSDLCERTAAITDGLLARAPDAGPGPLPRPPPISVATMEEHLRLHEDISAKLHAEWRHRYASSKVRTQEALFAWTQPKQQRTFESIDEIHERLVITAANAVQLGADDDDDEQERRAEKLSAYTPFSRRKVNKSRERSQIHEWARRRQPPPGQLGYTAPQSGGSASALPAAPGAPRAQPGPAGLGLAAPAAGGFGGASGPAARKPGSAPGAGSGARSGAEGTMVYVIGQS